MLALQKMAPRIGALEINDVEFPEPGPSEVRIAVDFTGICGTDLNIYNWLPHMRFARLPVVMGHEISGIVDAVGPGVKRVAVGDRVSVESHIPCGVCNTCLAGRAHICPQTRYPGIHIDGGFARYVVLPEVIVWPVDPRIPQRIAALMEPFGIAVHAAFEGSGVAGQNVVVAGCGPIGLMNVLVARALGANRVIATDINPHRLRMAEQLGADCAVNVSESNAQRAVADAVGPQGVDVYLEYAGASASLALASEVVVPGGEIRLLAVPPPETAPDLGRWLHRGLVVRGLHGRRLFSSWLQATRLLVDGKVDLTPLISHVLPLKEAEFGFQEALHGRALKVLITPG